MVEALILAKSGTAPINLDHVWTPLLISIALMAAGSLAAFNIGGLASAPWRGPDWFPSPYKLVGWTFILVGAFLFVLSVAILIRNA